MRSRAQTPLGDEEIQGECAHLKKTEARLRPAHNGEADGSSCGSLLMRPGDESREAFL